MRIVDVISGSCLASDWLLLIKCLRDRRFPSTMMVSLLYPASESSFIVPIQSEGVPAAPGVVGTPVVAPNGDRKSSFSICFRRSISASFACCARLRRMVTTRTRMSMSSIETIPSQMSRMSTVRGLEKKSPSKAETLSATGSPFSPGGPAGPLAPVAPMSPRGPVKPIEPMGPELPVAPIGPRGP